MKSLGYIGAFLGGAIAGAALGILMAPEKGEDTRVKITDAVEDFLKKHNIKLSRKEVVDLVDDIEDSTTSSSAARKWLISLTTSRTLQRRSKQCFQATRTLRPLPN